MTEDRDQQVILEAIGVIDEALSWTHQRDLVSGTEVSDMLLDLRTVLAAPDDKADVPEPAAVG